MGKRYETHTHYGGENEENYDDGIIDTKNDDEYICNWHYVAELLNDYEKTIEKNMEEIKELQRRNSQLIEESEVLAGLVEDQHLLISKFQDKTDKLEELLMLRKIQKEQKKIRP